MAGSFVLVVVVVVDRSCAAFPSGITLARGAWQRPARMNGGVRAQLRPCLCGGARERGGRSLTSLTMRVREPQPRSPRYRRPHACSLSVRVEKSCRASVRWVTVDSRPVRIPRSPRTRIARIPLTKR